MVRMSKLEKEGEREVREWCLGNGVIFIKFTPFGEVGWPDRIAILPGGSHIWIEMKRKGESPRPIQYYRIEKLQEQGAEAVWFDNPKECIEYLRGRLNG